jgi:hypothetical protein
MARVLLVGYDPEAVDYSNPAYPPGMTAEKITLKQMTDRGWESDACYIRPDKAAGETVKRHLASANYDCVVIRCWCPFASSRSLENVDDPDFGGMPLLVGFSIS